MMRKKTFGLGVLVILVGIMTIAATFYFSPEQRLQRLGYSAEEAREFACKLDENALDELVDRAHSTQYIELLAAENFAAENFLKYLAALDRNQLGPASTVRLVNHPDYDENLTYTADMLSILLHERYISANSERYFNYLTKHVASSESDIDQAEPDIELDVDQSESDLGQAESAEILSTDQIISAVNANRDYEYYTNTTPTNLDDNHLMLVNKYYFLDESFIPDITELGAEYGAVGVEIERETKENFLALYDAALESGFRLYVTSGYRGYADQTEVYNSWVASVGEDAALNYAALPGYSEHQTGRALDIFVIGETTNTFAQHPAAKWLAENAWRYGFILRYPEAYENLTGYAYEAWHFRYVGQPAAAEISQNDLTLEEYWALKHR